jgi:hypothetical protein
MEPMAREYRLVRCQRLMASLTPRSLPRASSALREWRGACALTAAQRFWQGSLPGRQTACHDQTRRSAFRVPGWNGAGGCRRRKSWLVAESCRAAGGAGKVLVKCWRAPSFTPACCNGGGARCARADWRPTGSVLGVCPDRSRHGRERDSSDLDGAGGGAAARRRAQAGRDRPPERLPCPSRVGNSDGYSAADHRCAGRRS